jgi:hypothetical protein
MPISPPFPVQEHLGNPSITLEPVVIRSIGYWTPSQSRAKVPGGPKQSLSVLENTSRDEKYFTIPTQVIDLHIHGFHTKH